MTTFVLQPIWDHYSYLSLKKIKKNLLAVVDDFSRRRDTSVTWRVVTLAWSWIIENDRDCDRHRQYHGESLLWPLVSVNVTVTSPIGNFILSFTISLSYRWPLSWHFYRNRFLDLKCYVNLCLMDDYVHWILFNFLSMLSSLSWSWNTFHIWFS